MYGKVIPLPPKDDMGLMKFGDLQAMRRVKTGRRLMLQKWHRAATATVKGNPSGDSFHHGGGSSNAQTSPDEDVDNPVKKLKAANTRLYIVPCYCTMLREFLF